ncbi:MAG: hypothetical protein AAGC46_05600 [Solirubrobacteraceae bacterium]|nr:hypothetical protein [Patulibacter sp.]
MTTPEPMLVRIAAATSLGSRGEPRAAELELTKIWDELGDDGDPLHRCAVAHALADLQPEVREELAWDLRALDAAAGITDERAAAATGTAARGFAPSLHLNVAEAYRKLGDLPSARVHVDKGLAHVDALEDDGYGRMIHGGLARLSERLAADE